MRNINTENSVSRLKSSDLQTQVHLPTNPMLIKYHDGPVRMNYSILIIVFYCIFEVGQGVKIVFQGVKISFSLKI